MCVFFSSIKDIEEHFAEALKKIPTSAIQKQSENYSKLAGAKRLDKYGEFGLIDNLVRLYNGTYNHDDIFEMDVLLVHNLILYNKELSYVESRKEEIQRQAELTKKK